MNTQTLIATVAGAVLFLGAASAHATAVSYSVTGTYTGSATGANPPGSAPTVTWNLGSSFSISASGPLSNTRFVTTAPGPYCGSFGCIETETLNVDFSLSDTSGGTGSLSTTGTYDAKYGGSELGCSDSGSGDTDCIVWNGSSAQAGHALGTGSVTDDVTLTDGAVVALTLYNAEDWTIHSYISGSLVNGPTGTVPEPASMVLFASGLAALPVLRRRLRRKPAQTA